MIGLPPSIFAEKTCEFNQQNEGYYIPRLFSGSNKLFLIYKKQGVLNIEEYNFGTSSWTPKGILPSGISHVFAASSWNDNLGNVYLPCTGGAGNKLYKYSTSNNSWQSLTNLPFDPTSGIRLVGVSSTNAYFTDFTKLWKFDEVSQIFSYLDNSNISKIDANLPGFTHIGMAKNEIVFCNDDTVYRYDSNNKKWEFYFPNTATYPSSFVGVDTKSVNGKMYLIFQDWQLVTVLELEIF